MLDTLEVYDINTLLLFDLSGRYKSQGSLPTVQEAAVLGHFVIERSSLVSTHCDCCLTEEPRSNRFPRLYHRCCRTNEAIEALGDFQTQDRSNQTLPGPSMKSSRFRKQAKLKSAKPPWFVVIFTDGKINQDASPMMKSKPDYQRDKTRRVHRSMDPISIQIITRLEPEWIVNAPTGDDISMPFLSQ